MAETVVSLTLETIRDLLVEEAKFLSGVSSQVKDVQTELLRMQSFLEDVDKRKYQEQSVRNYIREIRVLSYRIEDVVETYVAEVLARRRKKGIHNMLNRFACVLCECKSVHEVGSEITVISTDIANLRASMEAYGIRAVLEREKSDDKSERKKWLRKTYAHGLEEHFVGMKNDINLLIKMLLDDERKHRVVSICGMGGLGKTTLAKKIYHHGDVRRGFEAFAWVSVSQECKPKSVFQDLLKQLLPNPDSKKKEEVVGMGDSELVDELYKVLKGQKCLVVLDDIWEVDDWKSLSPAFPIAEANSKILITTRKESVAEVGFAHYLGFLSEDEGWELMQNKAFTTRDPKDLSVEPKVLEQVGREMVQKCGYLPLAISVLGGILSKKKSFDAWELVNKDIDLYLRRGTGNEGDGAIQQVLSLSYDDLPYHLKPCFLYLSCFQEDESIGAEDLYLLWMAEGIVSPRDQEKEETLMDVAKRYLSELASRSMVQVQVDKILAPEEFESCRLHDLLRDQCLVKSVEEEFLNVIDFRGGKRPSLNSSSASSCSRRLAVYMDLNLDGVSLIGESTQQLRSLLLHFPLEYSSVLPQGVIDFENFKFLRVLKFENVEFEGKKLLEGLRKLIHLRLLGFRYCQLQELPSCIGYLPILQTLDLRYFGSPEIPNVLWKIKRLKYLYLPEDCASEGKVVLSGLNELEMINGFNSLFCEITDLSKLKSLRRLKASIYGNENLSKFIDCIEVNGKSLETTAVISDCDFRSEEGKILLRKLFMSCSIQDIFMKSHICKLPENEPGFFQNLAKLILIEGKISKDPMSTLEKLPKLRILLLLFNSFVGKEMICHATGFPQLRELELHSMVNLEKWTVEEGAMPLLLRLCLGDCEKLEMIPEGLRFITTLQTLDIGTMSEEFKNRIREGGEDFDKVRHVNSIITHR